MKRDNLNKQISNRLLKVRAKEITCDDAVTAICEAFEKYGEWSNDERILDDPDGIKVRVREAIEDFLVSGDPEKPGVAIHDAIDHMFNG